MFGARRIACESEATGSLRGSLRLCFRRVCVGEWIVSHTAGIGRSAAEDATVVSCLVRILAGNRSPYNAHPCEAAGRSSLAYVGTYPRRTPEVRMLCCKHSAQLQRIRRIRWSLN